MQRCICNTAEIFQSWDQFSAKYEAQKNKHHHQKGQCLTYLYAKIIYNKKNQAVQFTALPVSHVTDAAPLKMNIKAHAILRQPTREISSESGNYFDH